ncbi:AraC family transcriptional regulator [Gracilibacillus phocaeensis]|uniref:AraC family transcriptional regulator n=1 Tax=Gracilibacillus phocaeensis TaxID=2042304 RepID=UPI001031E7D8|nr:AraC family transcriptional regulator [Gracilibacillus phocaeensis]
MDISQKEEVERLRRERKEWFGHNALHILNGQAMYQAFLSNQLIRDSDYLPFNEAMCVHPTTKEVFTDAFIDIRAKGHQSYIADYRKQVMKPLEPLFERRYQYIVLWFGEDMFCQMKLLTLLAYLEQSSYQGKVILNRFTESGPFKVDQQELELGKYATAYEEVLINQSRPSVELPALMIQAINIYLAIHENTHPAIKYIAQHKHLPITELVNQLLAHFPEIGYGDVQYNELINKNS